MHFRLSADDCQHLQFQMLRVTVIILNQLYHCWSECYNGRYSICLSLRSSVCLSVTAVRVSFLVLHSPCLHVVRPHGHHSLAGLPILIGIQINIREGHSKNIEQVSPVRHACRRDKVKGQGKKQNTMPSYSFFLSLRSEMVLPSHSCKVDEGDR